MQAEALPAINTIVLEEPVRAKQLGHFGQTDLLQTRKFLRIASHMFAAIASKICPVTSFAGLVPLPLSLSPPPLPSLSGPIYPNFNLTDLQNVFLCFRAGDSPT